MNVLSKLPSGPERADLLRAIACKGELAVRSVEFWLK